MLDAGVNARAPLLGGSLLLDLGISRGRSRLAALQDGRNRMPADPRAQCTRLNFSGVYPISPWR